MTPISFIDEEVNSLTVTQFGYTIDDLKNQIAIILNRPSMKDNSLAHESYFSLAVPFAYLKRHLDEKHEELRLKGDTFMNAKRAGLIGGEDSLMLNVYCRLVNAESAKYILVDQYTSPLLRYMGRLLLFCGKGWFI